MDFSKGPQKTLINSKMKSLFLLPYPKVNHVEYKSFGLWHIPIQQGNVKSTFSCAHHTGGTTTRRLTGSCLFQIRDVHLVLFQTEAPTDLFTPQHVGLLSGNIYLNYQHFKSLTTWELQNNVLNVKVSVVNSIPHATDLLKDH